ncbi:GntR family transcriptional regulator [Blastococcus saxobsidens]|uniref:Transcriptional regulator, GntR family n=1 Tax=Blastococcus saxobsidens (strain DD2) TaxID=1146883 RepID=H6RS38_BLASD|nr:GntR family transcriptional regulator [Blastococcus saxobsidens]CCG04232.1 Transcriptional regulator, GntR family [Blastococcus saxobsidens DD2]
MAECPGDDRAFMTKGDVAYARIRTLILSGELAAGAVLPQAALARTIGMSTTPLREALRRLKQEGLVELDAHRDARVRPLDATEARDLLELRSALDPLAASLAAHRRTDADLAEIAAALAGLEALTTHPSAAQLESHHRFHAAVHRASHNALLVQTLDGLWVKTDRYRRHALEVGRSEADRHARATEHRLVLEAVRDRDAEAAAERMRRHVETSLGARSADRLADEGAGTDRSTT